MENNNKLLRIPKKRGLYDPAYEKDSCGVGMVANIKGIPSRQIMEDAYLVNSRMDHRGGCGFEENTGDGAGILVAIPDKFFREICKKIGIQLPKKGSYAVGNIFLPQNKKEREFCKREIEKIIKLEGKEVASRRELQRALRKHKPGETVTLTIERDGETKEVKVTFKK